MSETQDIYTERDDVDPITLNNLGPLTALAGIWEGTGSDLHPVAEGEEREGYIERMELHPIDPQSNGPQVLYGLRYRIHITKIGETETFHDQVGYWLWEPATKTVMQTLSIPRAQIALAGGHAEPDARTLTVKATLGSPQFGICSGPFLDENFKTLSYSITIAMHDAGTFSYESDTVLQMPGREAFHHTDRNTLRKIGEPRPNPRAAAL